MPTPVNFQMQVRAPFEQSLQGVQSALQLSSALDAGALSEQQIGLVQAQREANTALAEQRKAQTLAAEKLQTELGAVAENPTPSAIASVMVRNPALAEQLKTVYNTLSAEQQTARVGQASQIYAALRAGKPDIAKQLVAEQAAGFRNSGMENDAKSLDALGKLIDASPETAVTSTGMFLAAAMGPEKFTENFSKLENERRTAAQEPATLTEAQAKAAKAATEAKFAESKAALEITKAGWDITKVQEDIAINKENARIAAMNAALSREANGLKRKELELQIEAAKTGRDDKVRAKIADLESSRATIDNTLNTIDKALSTPYKVINSATGPINTRIPTTNKDVADFEELINTVRSQAFLAQVPMLKGMGALSDAEGKKIESGLQSLSLRQSPERLISGLQEIQRILMKARSNLAKRNGMPDTVPDTPSAASRGGAGSPNVDDIVKKYTPGGGASGNY